MASGKFLTVAFDAEPALSRIREAAQLLGDMTPVYQDIREYLIDVHKQRFVKGISPDGKAWAPKSEATLERYRRLGYGSRAMTRPLIGNTGALSSLIIGFVSKHGVVIGSNRIQAAVMQTGAAKGAFGKAANGSAIPWGRIPARVWLGLSAADETAIVEIVQEHIAAKLGGTA